MSRRPVILKLTPEEAEHVGLALATASVAAYESPVMSNRHARIIGAASDRLLRSEQAREVNGVRAAYENGHMTRIEALHSIAASGCCDLERAAWLLDRDQHARPRDFREGR
jgi:hypothetical protein